MNTENDGASVFMTGSGNQSSHWSVYLTPPTSVMNWRIHFIFLYVTMTAVKSNSIRLWNITTNFEWAVKTLGGRLVGHPWSGYLRGATRKKPDCINHALGTIPIGKPLAHRETQLFSSIRLTLVIPFLCFRLLCTVMLVAFVTILLFCVAFVCTPCCWLLRNC